MTKATRPLTVALGLYDLATAGGKFLVMWKDSIRREARR